MYIYIYIEVIDKQKCCKYKIEKEADEHKYCSKCREYFKEYDYKTATRRTNKGN